MIRLDRIYTKTGDTGDTRLVGGQKVRKDSPRIEAYGTVDELSSVLGIARTLLEAKDAPPGAGALGATLRRVQNELFNLGSDLATRPEDLQPGQPVIREEHVTALEREIDGWNESLPPLKSFVLPGGGLVGAHLHVARTVCRRAEREALLAARAHDVNRLALVYLNRLSDLLFILARAANGADGQAEPLWRPVSSS
jgi:cob(I)alamin adenosyltransferase